MRKNLLFSRYAIAGFVVFMVFVTAFMLGTYMEGVRNESLRVNIEEQRNELNDLLLQYQYISELEKQQNCEALAVIFHESLEQLDTQSQRLQGYEEQRKLENSDYKRLRKAYTVSQVNYWLLAKRLKDLCGMQYSDILYFFSSPKNCADCENQGIHLDYVKKRLGDEVLIFALDGSEEGIIALLKANYEVERFPTLVIDDVPYNYSTNEEIIEILCAENDYGWCA